MMSRIERAELNEFRDYIADRFGLAFEDARLDRLSDVLIRRIELSGSHNFAVYMAMLRGGDQPARTELRALAQDLTVSETYFFRCEDDFRALSERVLPERLRACDALRQLNILSAGCSTGEEPFTIAMLLCEHVPDLHNCRVSIRCVDVNATVLARAGTACYSTWSMRATPEFFQRRYFRPQGKNFYVTERIRSMVNFEERNLLDENADLWRPDSFDIVFCRNVLMYMTPGAIRTIVTRFEEAIVPGGFLFLGSAETLRGYSQAFQLCHTHDTFYYQRRSRAAARHLSDSVFPVEVAAHRVSVAGPARASPDWLENIGKSSERIAQLTNIQIAGMTAADSSPDDEVALATPAPAERSAAVQIAVATDLLRRERFQEAIEILRSLPGEAARDIDVQLLLAVILTQQGDIPAAERAARHILARDDLNAGAHYVCALCRESAGDPGGAREHNRLAAYLDPAFAMPHLHLALLAKAEGRPDEARQEFGIALRLLAQEDTSRILFFGGGFQREALVRLCRAGLERQEGSV
jgi:chemotaxis protein methyltransferase CheR